MSRSRQDRMKPIFISVIVVLLISIGGYAIYQHSQCREELYFLYRQEINTTTYQEGGDCSTGCLFMRVIPKYPVGLPNPGSNREFEALEGHLRDNDVWDSLYQRFGRTFYFANETKIRSDLNDGLWGSLIVVQWCKTPAGERIRGVKAYGN